MNFQEYLKEDYPTKEILVDFIDDNNEYGHNKFTVKNPSALNIIYDNIDDKIKQLELEQDAKELGWNVEWDGDVDENGRNIYFVTFTKIGKNPNLVRG